MIMNVWEEAETRIKTVFEPILQGNNKQQHYFVFFHQPHKPFFIRIFPPDRQTGKMSDSSTAVVKHAAANRKVFSGKKRALLNKIPDDILHDAKIAEDIATLPKNYNFEVYKTIWRIRTLKGRRRLRATTKRMEVFVERERARAK